MKIAVLGTGMVGNAIGTKLVQLNHDVMMGSRTANNEKAVQWVKSAGAKGSNGTFSDAARFAELIINCTSGGATLEALKQAGTENMKGKILIDIANPLDFSKGMPPGLIPALSNTTSLGEEVQKSFADVKVVKTLNTMNCYLMMNPSLVPGDHNVFMSGNDADAKLKVKELLKSIGWQEKNIIELGDITTARGTEQMLPIWLRLWGALKNPMFNFKIVIGEAPKM